MLKYNHQSRDYLFVRDEHSSIHSLLGQNYSKVYFIKHFPGVETHKFEDLVEKTFFVRPSSTSKVSDSYTILQAMKNDLNVSHIFGVYHLSQSTRKPSDNQTSLTKEQTHLINSLQQSLRSLEMKENLDIIFLP